MTEPLLFEDPNTGDVWIGATVAGVVAFEDDEEDDAEDDESSELSLSSDDEFDEFDESETFCDEVPDTFEAVPDDVDVEADALFVAGWATAAR